jgi:hypothetical protein
MPDNSGQESFDFSNPFTNTTVEVEAVSKQQDVTPSSELHDRFEEAKRTVVSEDTMESSKASQNTIPSQIPKHHKNKVGIHQWLMTFLLLIGLCAVSTYAFITYKQNQTLLADSARQAEVAGVKSPELTRIVGKTFTVELLNPLPLDYKLETTVSDGPNPPSIQSLLAKNGINKSGINVLSFENSTQKTDLELSAIVIKNFGKELYPESFSVAGKYKVVKPLKDSSLPTIYFAQTDTMFYEIQVYNTIPSLSSLPEKIIQGIKLN